MTLTTIACHLVHRRPSHNCLIATLLATTLQHGWQHCPTLPHLPMGGQANSWGNHAPSRLFTTSDHSACSPQSRSCLTTRTMINVASLATPGRCWERSAASIDRSVELRRSLNQATADWYTDRVTLSGAQGLVCRREASPPAPHDRRGRGRARYIIIVWFDLVIRVYPKGDQLHRSMAMSTASGQLRGESKPYTNAKTLRQTAITCASGKV